MVDWSFILGQAWLLSNYFLFSMSKLSSSKFCHVVHCYTMQCGYMNCCFVVKALANAIMQCKQRQLTQKQFRHVLQNWLLCSHPWPNINEQCTKWKQNNYAIMHWNQFCQYLFSILRNFESNLGFLFLNSQVGQNVMPGNTFTTDKYPAKMTLFKNKIKTFNK